MQKESAYSLVWPRLTVGREGLPALLLLLLLSNPALGSLDLPQHPHNCP